MLYHCFASFKQSLLDFFKLADSRLILMLFSGVYQSHLRCLNYRSENVNLNLFPTESETFCLLFIYLFGKFSGTKAGLDYVASRCASTRVLLKDKIIVRKVSSSW